MPGYWLKTTGRTTYPRAVVSVVADLVPSPVNLGPGRSADRAAGYAVCAARHRRGQWRETVSEYFSTGWELHDWCEAWGVEKGRTTIVAPIASEILSLSGFWARLEEWGASWYGTGGASVPTADPDPVPPEYTVSNLILRGKPDIVTYRRSKRGLSWVSGRQYFEAGEPELAKAVRFPWQSEPLGRVGRKYRRQHTEQRAALWLTVFQELINWWIKVAGGPWGSTVGQLAWSFWRSRLLPRTVLKSVNPEEAKLLSEALYGGRASVWYYGDVVSGKPLPEDSEPEPPRSIYPPMNGPLHHFDARSLYPYLLATERFPTRFHSIRDQRTPAQVRDKCESMAVVVRCRITKSAGEYPCRHEGRVCYPAGDLDTVLCGPEYALAFDEGRVKSVGQCAVYDWGRPFGKMADELLRMREQARHLGEPAWELFIKTLSNSLAGKMAQRRGQWVADKTTPAHKDWGEWWRVQPTAGKAERFLAVAGLVHKWTDDPNDSRPLPAAFAFLTAYGRLFCRAVRESLPPRSAVAQDTDSLWLTSPGAKQLHASRFSPGESAGRLRAIEVAPAARFLDARHYWTPRGWVLSGFVERHRSSSGLRFWDRVNENQVFGASIRPPTYLRTQWVEKSLNPQTTDQYILRDGWAIPKPLA